jgi:hypothetical protein
MKTKDILLKRVALAVDRDWHFNRLRLRNGVVVRCLNDRGKIVKHDQDRV